MKGTSLLLYVRSSICQISTSKSSSVTTSLDSSLEYYEYDGWNLSYRTISSSDDDDDDDCHQHDKERISSPTTNHNVLLIHPVGIGISSWFWEPFLSSISDMENNNNNQISKAHYYAPNLIGCGTSEGSDAWDPEERGMFIPFGWVRGCEAFINHINDNKKDSSSNSDDDDLSWTVVTHGGLAPIGILLADRNQDIIHRLVLTSPPTWENLTTAVPGNELERNYNFLRSPIWGKLAFKLLESRQAIEFFSNKFLFSNKCDNTWLDKTEQESGVNSRQPVVVFNAGMCMNRGLQLELTRLEQPTLVIQGEDDKRQKQEYSQNMKNCQLIELPGQNVIPWEYPKEMANLLVDWIKSN